MAKADKKSKLWLEIIGVLLLALTLLTVISLASYNPADETANLVGGSRHNLAGVVGAHLADILFQFTGAIAYLLPALTFLLGLNCLLPPEKRLKWYRFAGTLLGLLASNALLALRFKSSLTLFGVQFAPPGGVAGDMARKLLLIPYLNTWGAYLVSCTLLLIAVMVVTGLSLQDLGAKSWALLSGIAGGCWKFLTWFKDKVKSREKPAKMTPPKPSKRSFTEQTKNKIKSPEREPEDELAKEEVSPSEPIIASSPPPIIFKKKEPIEDTLEMNPLTAISPGSYRKPDLSLLDTPKHISQDNLRKSVLDKSTTIETKLRDFGIEGRIVQVNLGPVITCYEFEPAPGIKINKITNMADDLALALKAHSVRIVAPIPGKAVVGIEIPNRKRQIIFLQEILAADCFQHSKSCLTIALGKDTEGNPAVTDLASMPHLLIAGATGSGKSVALNTTICSILYKASPAEVRFVMVDPKMLELGIYNGIPHLQMPVVTDPKKAVKVLFWATREMEERYQTLAEAGVRNIEQYNKWVTKTPPPKTNDPDQEPPQPLPYIVIVIDEFADLMLMASKDIEGLITRLAQMARAVGIHLIVATQRPSVDVITGIIKANFPCRISFRVASKIDSRTILDTNGAEKLLGKGDMLFVPPHTSMQQRIHGAMVSEKEVKSIVDFLEQQTHGEKASAWKPSADPDEIILNDDDSADSDFDDEYDEFYDQAVDIVIKTGQASISMIQRRLRIGYNRAARMVEVMERDGVVGPAIAGKPRQVLVKPSEGVND